ncbi:hypothetical protein HYH38_10045 [Clostridium botulinum]|nr:hypothetical protein [Clostridium botulinum]ACD53263.1 hypothetical protein CLH_2481 [Clostridium botulinum E3 str. Alaska E43]MBY6816126.1 hypothetical protein [Clostridium botulinum]MBY6827619.1 hypothetical protein [Clostridium botulinum]MBY6859566.1 hypothetical protein [Clostridium botulinum]MBY6948879.1 hypothetical protein [Clostridium botulinum]
MNILTMLRILEVVLRLIVNGLSKSDAIAEAATKFGISENIIKTFIDNLT